MHSTLDCVGLPLLKNGKVQNLDSGLDYGLDFGLDFGLGKPGNEAMNQPLVSELSRPSHCLVFDCFQSCAKS